MLRAILTYFGEREGVGRLLIAFEASIMYVSKHAKDKDTYLDPCQYILEDK